MSSNMDLENLHVNLIGTGINKYPAKQHALNVVRHMNFSQGLIYIPGQHELSIEDSDFEYPFHQRRAFYYMSGVDEPDCHITYDIEKGKLVLYIPQISPKQAVWFGRGTTLEEARATYDVDEVHWSSSLPAHLQQWTDANNAPIFLLHPSLPPPPLSNPPPYNNNSLSPAITSSRTIKTPHEIALIRHAISISTLAHTAILHHLHHLPTESAIHALFLAICTTNHAPRQAYPPIVASGPNASILHYTANNRPFHPRTDLLTLDAGAAYALYASDITRTIPLHPSVHWPTLEAISLYALVARMQDACLARVKPGVRFATLFRFAQRIAVDGLIRLRVLTIPDTPAAADAFIDHGGIFAFFPHGLGHHLGLDVHDVGPVDSQPTDLSTSPSPLPRPQTEKPWPSTPPAPLGLSASASVPLAPGMVLTVEPGLYFNAYTLQQLYLCHAEFRALVDEEVLAKYVKVGGVRIEDDVLVTREGCEVLSRGVPKGEGALEAIREGGRCGHGCGCPFRVEGMVRS